MENVHGLHTNKFGKSLALLACVLSSGLMALPAEATKLGELTCPSGYYKAYKDMECPNDCARDHPNDRECRFQCEATCKEK